MDTEAPAPPLATRLRHGTAMAMLKLGRGIADLVLPPGCIACRAAVSDPGALCAACWRRLEFITPPLCERLGTPLPYDSGSRISPGALAQPPAYSRARAAVTFGEVARDLVHALKYADRIELAAPLGGLMARAGAELLTEADALVPVPLHPLRLWRRRFNQSAALAMAISRSANVPVRTGWLERRRATIPQVGLDRAARAPMSPAPSSSGGNGGRGTRRPHRRRRRCAHNRRHARRLRQGAEPRRRRRGRCVGVRTGC